MRGRFGWEILAGDIWVGVLCGKCTFTPLLLPLRSFYPSRGDRDRTVHVGMVSGEDGGSAVVEGGVNGVIVGVVIVGVVE